MSAIPCHKLMAHPMNGEILTFTDSEKGVPSQQHSLFPYCAGNCSWTHSVE